MNNPAGWIGIDLDGTLAHYERPASFCLTEIGPPIPDMVRLVKGLRARGIECRIFTARVDGLWLHPDAPQSHELKRPDVPVQEVVAAIQRWCKEHLGEALPVTNVKDFGMWALFDDRAVQVRMNTGQILGDPEALGLHPTP